MRTIKFRGQKQTNGVWVYGDLETKLNRIHKYDNDGNYAGFVNVNPDTIGQFTGLLDKNGKEIYEGDIVKCTNLYTYVGIVQWDLCNPCMCISYKNEYGYECVEYDFIKAGNMIIEVIDNIHDNPELQKGGEQ